MNIFYDIIRYKQIFCFFNFCEKNTKIVVCQVTSIFFASCNEVKTVLELGIPGRFEGVYLCLVHL